MVPAQMRNDAGIIGAAYLCQIGGAGIGRANQRGRGGQRLSAIGRSGGHKDVVWPGLDRFAGGAVVNKQTNDLFVLSAGSSRISCTTASTSFLLSGWRTMILSFTERPPSWAEVRLVVSWVALGLLWVKTWAAMPMPWPSVTLSSVMTPSNGARMKRFSYSSDQ